MLINEVDAIPQRNRHNLSDLKKRRGSTQANAATKLYTLDAFRGRNAQYTQQNKENRRGNRKRRKGRGNERGKIENGFQLHLCMPCCPLNGWECTMITPFTTCEWVNSVIPPR